MSDPAAKFISTVHSVMEKHQISWTDAWGRARGLYRDQYEALMTMKSPRIVQMANAANSIEQKKAARTRFIDFVHQAMDRQSLTYDEAWKEMRAAHPEDYREVVTPLPPIKYL
jgi:hypothetical protein